MLNFDTLFEIEDFEGILPSSVYTQIDSYGIFTVAIFVNYRQPKVLLFKDDKLIGESILRDDYYIYKPNEDYDNHHNFSIQFDPKGYVWVIGDMHNHKPKKKDQIDYHRDDLPEDMKTSSMIVFKSKTPYSLDFEFIGNDIVIDNTGFTYNKFVRSPDGKFYMTCRHHHVKDGKWNNPALLGFGLYEVKLITGSDSQYYCDNITPFGDNSLIHHHHGYNGHTYQKYNGNLAIDQEGNLHVVCAINRNKEVFGCTDLVYCHSKGDYWQKTYLEKGEVIEEDTAIFVNANKTYIIANINKEVYVEEFKKGYPINGDYIIVKPSHGLSATILDDVIYTSGHHPFSNLSIFDWQELQEELEPYTFLGGGLTSIDRHSAKDQGKVKGWVYEKEAKKLKLISI